MSPPVESLEAGYDPEIGDLNRPSPPKPLLGSPEADYDPEIGDLSRPPPEPSGLSKASTRTVRPTVVIDDPEACDQVLRPPLMSARFSEP